MGTGVLGINNYGSWGVKKSALGLLWGLPPLNYPHCALGIGPIGNWEASSHPPPGSGCFLNPGRLAAISGRLSCLCRCFSCSLLLFGDGIDSDGRGRGRRLTMLPSVEDLLHTVATSHIFRLHQRVHHKTLDVLPQ